jgi:hypothetical protein
MPLMGMVFNEAGRSWWFDIYVILLFSVKVGCVADISEERVATIFWVISTLKM